MYILPFFAVDLFDFAFYVLVKITLIDTLSIAHLGKQWEFWEKISDMR